MFLAEAEHQLKTPLAVIAGFVDVLVGGVALSMADTTSALDSIDRNTDLLSKQIDRLLEEAMAEFQVRDLHPALIDVGEALRASVEGSTMTGRRDLRVEAAGDVTAYLDSAVLDQIIGHLIDNAIKYSPAGAPIVLRARRAAQWLEIDVSDNGIGIPEDIDVFAAFQRGDGAAVQAKPGIGLGLHIVRNLTRAMAGEVTARRNQGGGSTFTLRFPAAT
jgi:signal transduction histidine kinase